VLRGRARLEKLRGKASHVVTSPAFDSRRWGASYAQSLRMLWDAFVDGARATSHPHVVVHEVMPRLAHPPATPAGRASASAPGARPSSPAPSSTGGFRISQKAARAAPQFAAGAAGARGAGQGPSGAAGGFAVRAPAQPVAPKPSKYKVAPSFSGPTTSPPPPARAAPSFGATSAGAGAGAQSSSGSVERGNVGGGQRRPKVPAWAPPREGVAARPAHEAAASSSAPHEQQGGGGHGAFAASRAGAGGWAIPSRRTGASSPSPPPPARSAPAWGGGKSGGGGSDLPADSKPTVKIPSW